MFYCHIKTDALVLASSLPGPKKDKSSEIKLELEEFNENEGEKYF